MYLVGSSDYKFLEINATIEEAFSTYFYCADYTIV